MPSSVQVIILAILKYSPLLLLVDDGVAGGEDDHERADETAEIFDEVSFNDSNLDDLLNSSDDDLF